MEAGLGLAILDLRLLLGLSLFHLPHFRCLSEKTVATRDILILCSKCFYSLRSVHISLAKPSHMAKLISGAGKYMPPTETCSAKLDGKRCGKEHSGIEDTYSILHTQRLNDQKETQQSNGCIRPLTSNLKLCPPSQHGNIQNF